MESTRTPQPHAARPVARFAIVGGGYLAAVAGLIWNALASGKRVYDATGDSYPGALTALAEPVGYFTASLAARCASVACCTSSSRPDRMPAASSTVRRSGCT